MVSISKIIGNSNSSAVKVEEVSEQVNQKIDGLNAEIASFLTKVAAA